MVGCRRANFFSSSSRRYCEVGSIALLPKVAPRTFLRCGSIFWSPLQFLILRLFILYVRGAKRNFNHIHRNILSIRVSREPTCSSSTIVGLNYRKLHYGQRTYIYFASLDVNKSITLQHGMTSCIPPRFDNILCVTVR